MEIERLIKNRDRIEKFNEIADFLAESELEFDDDVEYTVCIREQGRIVATGSRAEYLLKCIAVDENMRGSGLAATLMSELWQEAFRKGIKDLLIYTKVLNVPMFESLFFHTVASTREVALMEKERGEARRFVREQIETAFAEKNRTFKGIDNTKTKGSAVVNCNPFTRGHRYLIEEAAKQCDILYVFVVSENASEFSSEERIKLVKKGCEDLENVYVAETGPYLISKASFPQYFIRDKAEVPRIKCELDLEIFYRIFAKELGITKRFFGSEPLSELTRQYNETMKEYLPRHGIEAIEIERLEALGEVISAGRVRSLLKKMERGAEQSELLCEMRVLLPDSSFDYLLSKIKK